MTDDTNHRRLDIDKRQTRLRRKGHLGAPSSRETVKDDDDDVTTTRSAIVPGENVAGNALTLVIAIMGFLASLTLGAMTLVQDTASRWQSDIAREVTIQIRPLDGVDMAQALQLAVQIARAQPGVSGAEIVDEEATARLLEPWLGSDLDLKELPVPRLVTVTIEEGSLPDFAALKQKLHDLLPAASLDDHRAWVERLTTMARVTVIVGIIVFLLVLMATILTVVFATRGAMSGNRHIVEVLHFVGAERSYIANQFQNHFLLLGLKGAFAGGVAAMAVFALFGLWVGQNIATPEGDQMVALFGRFSVGLAGYAGTIALAFTIALLTAITSRMTVLRHVGSLDRSNSGE